VRAVNRAVWSLVIALGLGAGACAKTVQVRAPMLVPARLPVRAFPSIWVAGGDDPLETYLLDRLAAHLARDGKREVRRVPTEALEPAREAGQIQPTTTVLFLRASSQAGLTRYWDSAPVQYCGFYGCTMDMQTYVVNAVEVRLRADVTIYEGPTARVLQQESFEKVVAGDDEEALRQAAVEQLGVELERAVDVLRVRPRFELYKVRIPAVEAALEQIEKGDWDAGRAHLENAAKGLGGQDKETQARVWYNLGIARWAAPGRAGLTREAYESAQRALTWAQRLMPAPQHEGALAELEQARKRFQVLQEQRSATAYNFELAKRASQASPPAKPASQAEPGEAKPGAEGSGGDQKEPGKAKPAGQAQPPADAKPAGTAPPESQGSHAPADTADASVESQ
jgi:hypothetical protein